MNNIQKQYQEDEIDLRELLVTLWKNKILILAITTIFGITGVVYALLAPQVWSAKAVIVAPLPTQLEQLQFSLENLIAILNINKGEPDANKNPTTTHNPDEFLIAFSKTTLFSNFIQAFDSYDNKIEFLKVTGYAPKNDVKTGIRHQRFLEKSIKNISTKQNKNEEAVSLIFGAENSQEALKRLSEYLNFIQNKETTAKNKVLVDKIANQIKTLNLTYQAQETDTLKRLQEDIARTEFALRISKTAGIEAPVENLNNEDIFTIDLGAKALHEKLKILKEIKNPVLINPKLADIRTQLDSLRTIPKEQVNFTSYYFLQSPSEPLSRDKPKRALVVVLATLAGFMVGVMVTLIRASWSRRG